MSGSGSDDTSIPPAKSAVKKPGKEIPLFQDEGTFTHDTGDTYTGGFEIKKKDHSVKMNGFGVYTTASGETYSGKWDHDKLGVGPDPVTITFPEGTKYEGMFRDWCYNGPGKYTYPDGTVLECNFVDNCPIGPVSITDPNGHKWLGKSQTGHVWVEPENHYYYMLERTIELKRKPRKSKPPPTPVEVKPSALGKKGKKVPKSA